MTRRELIASAMAVAIARGDTTSRTSHLAVINDEVGLTPKESVAFAKQYGIQWMELRAAQIPNQPQYCEMLPESALRDLKKLLSDNGLSVTVLDSSLLKCALPGTVAVKREDFYVKYFAKLGLTDEMLFRDRLGPAEARHGRGSRTGDQQHSRLRVLACAGAGSSIVENRRCSFGD